MAQCGPDREFKLSPSFARTGTTNLTKGPSVMAEEEDLDQTDGKRLGGLVSHQDHREVISARHVQFVADDGCDVCSQPSTCWPQARGSRLPSCQLSPDGSCAASRGTVPHRRDRLE